MVHSVNMPLTIQKSQSSFFLYNDFLKKGIGGLYVVQQHQKVFMAYSNERHGLI